MPSMNSLLARLTSDYPELRFTPDSRYAWAPETHTVHFNAEDHDEILLLHELSHGILGHKSYQEDLSLVNMEAAAWEKAREISSKYGISISEEVINDNLNTYRDWMHARSTCPDCSASGYQSGAKEYTCPACTCRWQVNEARLCGLKRKKIRQ